MKEEYSEIKQLKDELLELRMELASSNKLLPWTMDNLEFILKTS